MIASTARKSSSSTGDRASALSAQKKAEERRGRVLVSMYSTPPSEELTLDEFESYAVDRLFVLRVIENLKAKGFRPREMEQQLLPVLAKYIPLRGGKPEQAEDDARKDALSHFILRIAYSRSEELRRWFLDKECTLFRHRLEKLTPRELGEFMEQNDLNFTEVSEAQKAEREQKLRSCAFWSTTATKETNVVSFEQLRFYEIPFYDAMDLVNQRAVYLEKGIAYVPQQRLHSIIVARFRAALSKSLVTASQSFSSIAGDPRLAPLLKNVEKHDISTEHDEAGEESGVITAEQIDNLAGKSMPLCMRELHSAMKRDHKLKHWGRQQYGLFLKAAGLSMEDSLRFFQAEFTKIMTVDAFSKEYAYNIRHRYGKEGKRTDYSPYGCYKIIMDFAPGPGEYHGCPYRHYDEDHLSALFTKTMHVSSADTQSIMGHVKKKNYQIACQRHFELSHPKTPEHVLPDTNGVGSHPNAWFKASRSYYTGGAVEEQPAAIAPAAASSFNATATPATPAADDA